MDESERLFRQRREASQFLAIGIPQFEILRIGAVVQKFVYMINDPHTAMMTFIRVRVFRRQAVYPRNFSGEFTDIVDCFLSSHEKTIPFREIAQPQP